MAYTPLHLKDLAELKTRVGNATDTAIATVLGLNYPTVEGFSVYVWNNTSTEVGDDNQVVVPTPRIGQGGRWIKVDLYEIDPTVASHIKSITLGDIVNWNNKLSNETDPSVPIYSKSLTSFNIIKSSTDPLYKSINYTPTSSEITTSLGYTPINPNGTSNQYITGDGTKINFPVIPNSQIQSDWNQSNNSILDFIKNKPTIPNTTSQISEGSNLYFTNNRSRTSISLTTNNTTGVATYDNSTGIINIPNYTANNPSYTNNAVKTINGAGVQISTTKNTRVSYTITHTIALTLVLTSGSSMVYLEISSNNTTWTTISQAGYSDAVGVAVALNKSTTNNVQGEVPSGFYVRLRAVTNGGGSASYVCGQEVQY